ncbi:MAG TPA: hydrogenase [Burkholderiaceae bacterium]|nr:hydrogenase [Burkholderiaceae bacterium]
MLESAASDAIEHLHPLLQRLLQTTGAALLDADTLDPWLARPGTAMLVFADEPDRQKETLDLAVIVPELHAARRGAFRVALLLPALARGVAPRYGFARWPAFVLLRDGRYLGAVDGLRDWGAYLDALDALLAAQPTRPPSVGIAVRAAQAAPPCH